MHIGLFIPCYIDQLFPRVGMSVVDCIERLGLSYDFPTTQTCCGQPMANTGLTVQTRPFALNFLNTFKEFDYIVCPSGSCVAMVRHHYDEYLDGKEGFEHVKSHTFELCEFLTDVMGVKSYQGNFPYQIGMHQSCHGLRELGMGRPSELMAKPFNKIRQLLEELQGINIVDLQRPDECCGFGGSFAIAEEAVSVLMGKDRIRDHEESGAEVIVSADMSCLMHLDGLIRRNKAPLRVLHVAEIFAECEPVFEQDS